MATTSFVLILAYSSMSSVCPFTFNLSISLCLRFVSCKQYVVGHNLCGNTNNLSIHSTTVLCSFPTSCWTILYLSPHTQIILLFFSYHIHYNIFYVSLTPQNLITPLICILLLACVCIHTHNHRTATNHPAWAETNSSMHLEGWMGNFGISK